MWVRLKNKTYDEELLTEELLPETAPDVFSRKHATCSFQNLLHKKIIKAERGAHVFSVAFVGRNYCLRQDRPLQTAVIDINSN